MLLYKSLTQEIIDAAYTVHKVLGHGFLEKVYENALSSELNIRNIAHTVQEPIKVTYKGDEVGVYIADIIVDEKVVLELKACKELSGEHMAQTLNYLKATDLKVGLLINFGSSKLEFKRLIK